MSSQAHDTHAQAVAIVARISRAEAAREFAAQYLSHAAAFERLSEESPAYVVNALERGLERWWRFLATGMLPAASEFELLREWTRARAAEGVRLEDLLSLFGSGFQWAWQLLRRHTHDDEFEALIELAEPMAQFRDRVSTAITVAYLGERELLVSEEERWTRSLLDRLCVDSPLDATDKELADRLRVPVDCPYSPFVVVMPDRPLDRHAALAAHLRRAGWRLAVTQSDRVVGLAWKPLDLPDLGVGPAVLLAIGEPTPRGELAAAREELEVLAEHGRRMGLLGRLNAEDYLLEMLLGCSPGLAARLKERVLAPLADDDHVELAHTLQTLVACRFDRTATSAALHVHRNTLAYRLGRIEEMTGLDLASPRDLACVYMAIGMGGGPPQP